MVEESCSSHDSQEPRAGNVRGRARTGHTPLGHAPGDLLPPARPTSHHISHLPKGISGLIHHEARTLLIRHFPDALPLNTAALGTQPPAHAPLGTFQI